MARRGAKSKYETQVRPFLDVINSKVRQGVIEEEIAKSLNISVASLNNYKNMHPELKEALSKGRGKDILQGLINSGIEAAKGYYKDIETTIIVLDDNGNPTVKQKTIQKQWFPPNQSLNQFYVKNFGKDEGFTGDPLEYEFKKAKQDFDEKLANDKNWFK